LFPDKLGSAKNAVACRGQDVPVKPDRYLAVHILGASSNGGASGEISLNYADGGTAAPLSMSDWTGGAKQGEKVGLAVRHLHSHGGDEPGKYGYLYHYSVPLDSSRTLTGITLPTSPEMKVLAITFERVRLPGQAP
ncbi:MAG: hypothetical protein ACPL7K_07220, partial [Armatimonadota bacterium]